MRGYSQTVQDNLTVFRMTVSLLSVILFYMAQTLAKGKLLIIDDESELREILSSLLEEYAGEIYQAANGLEGINLLKEHEFDAVLSDEKMPKKSGLEVLKWMRESGLQIPFIIHTGYGQKEMVQEAQRLGVYAFIDKPWDERTLISTVERALRTGVEKSVKP